MADIDHKRKTAPPAGSRLRSMAAWFDPDEPHRYSGPFARWPRTTDTVLAAAVFAASLVAVAASAIDDGEDFALTSIGDLPAGALALLALAATTLLWRRSHAIVVAGVVMALMIVWALAGYGDGHDLALVVASYTIGRYATDHGHSLATIGTIAAVNVIGTIIDANQRVDIVPAIVLAVLPWYVGRRVHNRGDYLALLQERAVRLEAEQHTRARQAVADERTRIARELHDVVAHRVSMMTIQAGAARTIAPHDLEAAIEAMGDVEGAGRQALGELRHLLGVLRPDVSDPDRLGPQPGFADIPALVDDLLHTGADVNVTIADLPDHIAAAVELSTYRIVQESLTNVIKHAGPNPTVDITLALDHDELVIEVTNTTAVADDTTTISAGLPQSGYGIAGMQERVTHLGGTLTTGLQSGNRHRVHARLPLESEPT
ncbi:MAG: sensor histidine kinase [Actinomycetia bacterium]|nr:sensor histidine kinase [Actinomycetes bacterium]